MEEVMTQDSSQVSDLQAWWRQTEFPGKEQYQLKDNGELVIKQSGRPDERTIGNLTPENADFVLKALMEKFQEVTARVQELKTEWDQSEDKFKLLGKVERTKDYLLHAAAVGDFEPLMHTVNEMQQHLNNQMEEHYQERLKLVTQAESLTDSQNWKETTQLMRELPEKWKTIGFTDKKKSDELWTRLEAARNKFFDRKRQNQEDINKEMLQNLDLKMELVEKAEKLAASENWKEATESFRQMMEDWKKTGRTLAEKNEELWHRFITAKNVFFDRKKVHFDTIQAEQEKNYEMKLALVEQAEALQHSTEWNKTVQALSDLMEKWKNIGRVPLEKADDLWKRMNAARDFFFDNKRKHVETVKIELDDNYARKLALVKRAEAIQDSSRWHETTDELNELMTEWKKIGGVPREHSNAIWERFIAARKKFFERKDANREHRKHVVEKKRDERQQQARNFVKQLADEIKEEEERLADFKNGIENITPGRKEQELRQHLTKLIEQTEEKISRKQKKLESVKKEMEEIGKQEQQKPAASKDKTTHEAEESDGNASE